MGSGDNKWPIPIQAPRPGDYHNRCSQCLLPETYPNISFNEKHVCNFCTEHEAKITEGESKKRKKRKEWMERFLRDTQRRNKSKYDCVLGYSGGKDSTYLLYILKEELGLKILTYTCDTGFLSEEAHRNISRTLEKLKVDHVWRRPGEGFYKRLYSYLLTHPKKKDGCVATVCPQCFTATSLQATKLAIENRIPLVIYGFSPAQIGGIRHRILQSEYMLSLLYPRLRRRSLFSVALTKGERERFQVPLKDFFKLPHILFPFNAFDYNIEEVKRTVIGKGFIAPGDEHPLRSNCHVNLLMIDLDSRRFRYHPYAKEFSQLVREGQIQRQEWLAQEEEGIKAVENGTFEREKIDAVLARLGLEDYYRQCVEQWK